MKIKSIFKKSRLVILLLTITFGSVAFSQSQSRFELGAMGGTNFYLGDLNSTIFNVLQPAYGGFFRVNINPRYAIKTQVVSASLLEPFEMDYTDISSRLEFNFYDYGLPNYHKRGRHLLSPYIFAGIGITSYPDLYNGTNLSVNFPFGAGLKLKVWDKMNIGLEWSMHKLFVDNFDHVDNPNNIQTSIFYNNDWYSFATLSLSYDLVSTGYKCR
jgi:hypothetical protein